MILIHIGLPKSGSTTIQTFLKANEDALRKLSVDYAKVGRSTGTAHHQFAHELMGRSERLNRKRGYCSDIAGYVQSNGHRLTVLSTEMFSMLNPTRIGQLGRALAAANEPVEILIVMRDQLSLIPSQYAQRIRFGRNVFNFDEFFAQFQRNVKFDQHDVCSQWAKVFGWEALKVRVLDLELLVNRDLIDDVVASMGLDLRTPEVRSLSRPPRANESAGWKTLEAMRALFSNQSGLNYDNLLVKLTESELSPKMLKLIGQTAEDVAAQMDWTKDKGSYLTRAQAQVASDSFLASIRQLNEALPVKIPEPLGLDARGFVERQFLPEASQIPRHELGSFYADLEGQMRDKLRVP